jgi:hypothetical protein
MTPQEKNRIRSIGGTPEIAMAFDSMGNGIRKLPQVGYNAGWKAHELLEKVFSPKSKSIEQPKDLLAKASSDPEYKLVFYSKRSTPQIIRSDRGEEPRSKEGYGEITSQRKATQEEVEQIQKGKWLRVDEKGNKPSSKDYKITSYRKQLGKKREEAISKEASVLSSVMRLWNPNYANEAFGKTVARAARGRGSLFVSPSFGAESESFIVDFSKKLLSRGDNSFLAKIKNTIGEEILSRYTTPGLIAQAKRSAGGRGKYSNLLKKMQERGFVFQATPEVNSPLDKIKSKTNFQTKDRLKKIDRIGESKYLEAKMFPVITKTDYMSKVVKNLDDTKHIEKVLDKKYPNGWVIKRDSGENSIGHLASGNPVLIISNKNRRDLSKLTGADLKNMVVQENSHLQDVNPIFEKLKTRFIDSEPGALSGKKEYRVHVVNGKVIPYATAHRGNEVAYLAESMMPFRSLNQRRAERLAEEAVKSIGDKSLLKNQVYGFDIGIGKGNKPFLIETNPSATAGSSGFLVDDLVQDAISANIAGRLPHHIVAKRLGYSAAGAVTTGAGTLGYQGVKKEAALPSFGIKTLLNIITSNAKKNPQIAENLKKVFDYRLLDPKNKNTNTLGGSLLFGAPSGAIGSVAGGMDAYRNDSSILNGMIDGGMKGFGAGAIGGAAAARYGLKPLQRGIGRVVTNVVKPYGYDQDVIGNIMNLLKNNPKKLFRAVVDDKPIYRIFKRDQGRDELYRGFFGLSPRGLSLSNGQSYFTRNGNNFAFNAKNPHARQELAAIKDQRIRGTSANDPFLIHRSNGVIDGPNSNSVMYIDGEKIKARSTLGSFGIDSKGNFSDVWDFALHKNELPVTNSSIMRGLISMIGTPQTVVGKTLSNAEAFAKTKARQLDHLGSGYQSAIIDHFSKANNISAGDAVKALKSMTKVEFNKLLKNTSSKIHS